MVETGSPLEILKLLDKSNCRECGKPTCMAFAVAVCNGQKQLEECPKLESETIERYGVITPRPMCSEQEVTGSIEPLIGRLATIDLSSAAQRLGATFSGGKLTIKCLGRDFAVDAEGNVTTGLHVHGWIMMPVLNYILDGAGIPISGNWVLFRDLENGQAQYPLFQQRCEKPCKMLADADTDLFEDILGLFGRRVEDQFASHISFVLYPLPRLPILIRYWKPEDGLDSNLNFLFDSTAAENLNIESIYTLGTGLVVMLEKIALRHGLQQPKMAIDDYAPTA